MPLVVTGERGRWDRTAKTRIHTERYRIVSCPNLGAARTVQRRASDWALGELETTPDLALITGPGKDSLFKRLTSARRDGMIGRDPVALQRAAATEAHAAFGQREAHLEARARLVEDEQAKDVTPRTLRALAKPPKTPEQYRRSHPSYRHKRQAIAVLDGLRHDPRKPRTVHVPGLGKVEVGRDLVDRPRSAQVVERGGRPARLHVQHGAELPVSKDPYGTAVGLDSGVTHTLTNSKGEHLDRPDTSALLVEAGRLAGHARRCGTRGSRQDRRLRARARGLRRRASAIQTSAECHLARDLSASADVLVIESLALPNLTVSAPNAD